MSETYWAFSIPTPHRAIPSLLDWCDVVRAKDFSFRGVQLAPFILKIRVRGGMKMWYVVYAMGRVREPQRQPGASWDDK